MNGYLSKTNDKFINSDYFDQVLIKKMENIKIGRKEEITTEQLEEDILKQLDSVKTEEKPINEVRQSIKEKVSVKRAYDYIGGNIRYKVVVKNESNQLIHNISVFIDTKTQFEVEKSINKIPMLEPGESMGVDFTLIPLTCGSTRVYGTISYIDAFGNPNSRTIEPTKIQVKCPLVQPKSVKLLDLKQLKENLPKNNSEIIFPKISKIMAYEIAREQISALDLKEIQRDDRELKATYSGESKVGNNDIIVELNVDSESIHVDVYGDDMKQVAGFMAFIKNLLNTSLKFSEQLSCSLEKISNKVFNSFEFFSRLSEFYDVCYQKGVANDIIIYLKELRIKSNSYFQDLKLHRLFANWIDKIEEIEQKEIDERTYYNLLYDIINWMETILAFSITNAKNCYESSYLNKEERKNIENGIINIKTGIKSKIEHYSKNILFNLMIINKDSGLILYTHHFTEDSVDTDLIGGFLTAIQSFGSEISKKETSMKKLSYEHFEIEIVTGKYVYVALITSGFPTEFTTQSLSNFIKRFEMEYEKEIQEFYGNISIFKDVKRILDSIFH